MTHLYSRGCEYALRALRAMVEAPQKVCTVTQLCEQAGTPEHFTRKMLQPLVRQGILRSARGPGGGFTFGRDPSEITLMEVVRTIEARPRFDSCLLGESQCDVDRPCPLHDLWEPIRKALQQMLEEKTVADLAVAEGEDSEERLREITARWRNFVPPRSSPLTALASAAMAAG